ncbi:MAG: putative colanic acid biosynthesis UDP-glucose lipid carrier transferase [Lentisphaeria bacterium]|jgi:putative colanic acid biosynthesis UDP-glucose lipid carrier transferase
MTDSSFQKTYNHRNKRLLQNHDTLVQWVQQLLNIMVVTTSLVALTYWRDGEILVHYRSMLVFALLLMTITYHMFGVLRRFDSVMGGIQHLARAWGVVIIILAWVAFLTKTSESYSRQVIVYWALLSFVLQALVFVITYQVYSIYRLKYRERIPAIIIGTGPVARHLASAITNNIWLSDKIVGVINYGNDQENEWTMEKPGLLGTEKELNQIIDQYNIRRIYVALPFALIGHIKDVQDLLIDSNIDLVWAPDIFEFRLLNHSVREVAGVPLLTLNETPLMAGGPAFIKAVMDKSVSLMAIVLLSPILIVFALTVKLTSPGPVIFKQLRDGWDGKKFYVYKFRSMYTHKPDNIVKQATKGDPRITRVGAFMRKTSIDELPQLFNVLEGSMSLVGPRPHAESHNEYYSDKVRTYLARHRIKPGMTGLAQINGLRGETETLELMSRRVELDLEYICNWSPLLDLKILLLTPMALLSKKAY